MSRLDIPANLEIMDLNNERVRALKPVKVLDIMDGATDNFHEDGLFSISIFGRVGSDERDLRFSFIDIRVEIFHPFIYQTLCELKGLYESIIMGRAYAVWNDKEKDFEASDPVNGQTGFFFFVSQWKNIVFKRTESKARDIKIEFIEKFKERALTSKIVVIPAGYRDIQVDESGRVRQSEINDYYRNLISISNSVPASNVAKTAILDTSRVSLQNAFNKIYEYLGGLIKGKHGFMAGKWASRRVFNGTRNVISAMDTSPPYLGAPNYPKYNDTTLGLFQLIKAMLPVTQHLLLTGWAAKVFSGSEGSALLTNPVSLKQERVAVSPDTIDRWTTTSGIEKVISSYRETERRHRPVMVEGYYLGLIYRGPDKTFKIFADIDELPRDETFLKEYVFPLTLCEYIYLAGYTRWAKTPIMVTRYPVTGLGSIYPSYAYVKNTINAEIRYELGETWEKMGEEFKAVEFPILDTPTYVDSLIPHPSRLQALGGDYDGDTCSANALYTDEAVEEVKHRLSRAAAYIDPNGGLRGSAAVETVERVLLNFTGE